MFCRVLGKEIYVFSNKYWMLFNEEKGRKQMTFAHQETLPAGNDAACPHLENWLCKYLNMNKY